MCLLTKKLARSRIVTLTYENSYVILTVGLFSSKIQKGLKLSLNQTYADRIKKLRTDECRLSIGIRRMSITPNRRS